ncbi:efflux RND transporter periplasmic adaptor subunit [Rhizobium sp. AG855]|uniref:efflux RND transporter periplasmic adaptor subunit n=1 Tax=Rhizobium sp. AG855 TaxID=2183898 RepID=UPI000E72713E|nr:efflux RND transporter periplasmic adaptor subunit [Rhizobium sp. AG855]RKE77538.1 RND family efflux transporter MFP subunit [Rhizobium sp. AG855]
MRAPALIPLLLLAGVLSSCSDDQPEAVAPVRPVLFVVAEPRAAVVSGFTGTVEAKFSTDLGFQVLGRITARHVHVGDLVQKGQVLANLDFAALELSVKQAEADLASANAKLDLARVTEQRQKTLVASNASTREQLEEAVQAREAAEATVQQLEASLDKVREQLTYATLTADTDGVVSAVSAEVGQVVSVGTPVVTIARLEARDAVVDIPDRYGALTAIGTPFEITLQANPAKTVRGTVRETTPQADPATRSRRTKIALESPPDSYRLGSTITASPIARTDDHLWLPESAVGGTDGKPFVWVIDATKSTVSRHEVEVQPSLGGGFDIISGINRGDRIVSAGVNSLTDNQPIRFSNETPL